MFVLNRYEKSYMHRDVVTHVAVSLADFFITGSCDGECHGLAWLTFYQFVILCFLSLFFGQFLQREFGCFIALITELIIIEGICIAN